jgi:sugar fermentation stimulation protein A
MTDPAVFIPFPEPRIEATFLRRRNRFVAEFRDDAGVEFAAHSANTGSMKGCLVPGGRCVLWDSQNDQRKYRLSWKAIDAGPAWVGIDTSLPNQLAAEIVTAGLLPELGAAPTVRREVVIAPGSRADLLVEDETIKKTWIEVKNVTLVEDGVARFPDAVTARGLKHLHELAARVKAGDGAMMIYVIQRSDGRTFAPAREIDPAYARALQEVHDAGVLVRPFGCTVSAEGVRVDGQIPYDLDR